MASLLKPEDLEFFNLTPKEIRKRITDDNEHYPPRFYQANDVMDKSFSSHFSFSLPTRIPNVFYDLSVVHYEKSGLNEHKEELVVDKR